VGARFTGARAKALHSALRDAAQTIDRMPSTFMTYPNGGRILPVVRGRTGSASTLVDLNGNYLSTFGVIRVPAHVWRAMRRNAAWIEPTLVAEWTRLMRDYGKGQQRQLSEEAIISAMRWSDPQRDVSRVREIAVALMGTVGLRCAWTDRPLSTATLDIDHMFPGPLGRAATCGTSYPLIAK